MNQHPFLRGIGLGALAGAALALGLTMTPKEKNNVRRGARRAARNLSHAVEDMTDAMGL